MKISRSKMYTIAPSASWNSYGTIVEANEAAYAYTYRKNKAVLIYEVDGEICRPMAGYYGGHSFLIPNQPWRPSEVEFEGQFSTGFDPTVLAAQEVFQ